MESTLLLWRSWTMHFSFVGNMVHRVIQSPPPYWEAY